MVGHHIHYRRQALFVDFFRNPSGVAQDSIGCQQGIPQLLRHLGAEMPPVFSIGEEGEMGRTVLSYCATRDNYVGSACCDGYGDVGRAYSI